ncbi:MAG TPA: D-arabinono-1,4-lactone oxidase, partial [Rubrobacteraceae bacterium]|nr:D-arabinono-1,4-lactone oxidase [Rubrobacteraceae bacterium]
RVTVEAPPPAAAGGGYVPTAAMDQLPDVGNARGATQAALVAPVAGGTPMGGVAMPAPVRAPIPPAPVGTRGKKSGGKGLVVGLGALGAVTRITLDVEPAYEVRQRVFEGLSWEALFEHFDEITSCGYSVSVFTRWGETADQVWVKSRVTDESERVESDLFGAVAAAVHRHPILELDPTSCTPQLGRPGLWSDRLPHFRRGFTPSSGEELQSEYLFPRRYAVEAIEAVRALADRIQPLLQVSEIRTVAADRLWMSMSYGEDSVGIHFTWKPERDAVEGALAQLETTLAPFGARPHWGKLFNAEAAAIAPLYERMPDFISLVERLDPRGAFRNSWLKARVLGES